MAATLYGIGRAAGLADLVERSIRRGDGDPELAELYGGMQRVSGTKHRNDDGVDVSPENSLPICRASLDIPA